MAHSVPPWQAQFRVSSSQVHEPSHSRTSGPSSPHPATIIADPTITIADIRTIHSTLIIAPSKNLIVYSIAILNDLPSSEQYYTTLPTGITQLNLTLQPRYI